MNKNQVELVQAMKDLEEEAERVKGKIKAEISPDKRIALVNSFEEFCEEQRRKLRLMGIL